MLWDGWQGIGRIVLLGLLTYPALVFLLRVSGKRTLSKFNAFDFVVTIALGSTIATILLNDQVSLAEGLAALALLIYLQFAVTWLSVRSERWQNLVKSRPSLLYHDGQFFSDLLRQERVTREEIEAALRENGDGDAEHASVILETDGTLSVVTGGR